ncbi:uncharacterized protein LOC128396692 [Panonychus citri]|uniref:uncharacterized protein LOC128396692 n=1 Tax=Panonychus citri TaxID=50023 RepID=UPI002307EF75|nr:uncharacterized protein LOC128396692 [Panonychus citri]
MAIAAGKAYVDEVICKDNKQFWDSLRRSKNKQVALAANLFMNMQVDHKQNGVCGRIRKCFTCWVQYDTTAGDHVCDVYTCNFCDVGYRASPHYCHVKPANLEHLIDDDVKPWILICYDIESMQITKTDNTNILTHQPNLLISRTMCTSCTDEKTLVRNLRDCEMCGDEEHVWYGTECVEQFCNYLYDKMLPRTAAEDDSRTAIQIKVIAHNQRGYDGHFIMQDFFKRKFLLVPNVIMSGSKILYSQMENIKFIDSLSLFMQPLSSLCKSFNIKEMKKGYFPHKFNTPENQHYVGVFPAIDFYDPLSLKPTQKAELEKWYYETIKTDPVFNFKTEIIEYCRSDVLILQTAIMRFIDLFKSITGLNPITRSFTLASVAMEVFRARMLPAFTLGVTPLSGYAERKQSTKGAAWLDLMQKDLRTKIRREWRLGPFYADGFIPSNNTVFEFWGCYYHGCPACYPDRSTIVTMNDEELTVESLYQRVLLKKEYYQHRGYLLHEIWEHEFDERERYTSSRISYYNQIKQVGSINIRESFYGGRTNNIKFFHQCSSDEVIRYLDFTSLYPFVLREYDYPLGHPFLIQEDFRDIGSYFGFIKCKVLPPTKLNIGVLPMRISKKLLFPLCMKCAVENIQTSCTHSPEERVMTSTWTSIELQEAVKYGYKIMKIYQVLNYRKTPHSGTLFSEYVKMWLKIKQESSDWPSWVTNEFDKQKYINDYKAAEGVELDPNSIEKNPGRRSIAKLMLNSFWGKLAQTANLPKTSFVRNYADLWGIVSDEQNEILGMHEPSEEVIMLQHRFIESAKEKISPGKTNIAVASFVTAYARRELFRLIQRIESHRQGRVLYFDTDSVVFVEKTGDPKIQCGDYLGQLTDEIEPGWKCNLFVSLGPKNYAYQVINSQEDTKSIIKVKGIRLTSKALDIITTQKLLEMAHSYIGGNQQTVNITQSNIVSDKFTHTVETRNFEKIYRAVSEKRRIIGNDTRPFGYVD